MGKIRNAYDYRAVTVWDEKIEQGAGHRVGLVCGARNDVELVVSKRRVGGGKRIR